MAGGGKADPLDSLEYTPTWNVAVVCAAFVIVSVALERAIHRLGKALKRRNQMALFEALEKLKEELMLMGFISLLLTVFSSAIKKICIPEYLTHHMLPCTWPGDAHDIEETNHHRRLLSADEGHKCEKGKKPFVSSEGMHELHIFIFVLAVTHVVFSVTTMLLGGAKIRSWKKWEEEIHAEEAEKNDDVSIKVTDVAHDAFVKTHMVGRKWTVISWVLSFFKQFSGSVTKTDYRTLRLGFIETHCKSNRTFNFHKYMMRTLEADFKKVVGISRSLWFFVVIFLLLNINGWHTYFWISFIPLILLLAVGAKLEHIIAQLAREFLQKNTAFAGDIVVRPSDEHFWFGRPKYMLKIIHLILFQNAFAVAYFAWILSTFGMDSCIMDKLGYVIPRLVICVIIEVLCSYSTLPLYALVTQMGSSFKSAIFEEHIHQGLSVWRKKAKKHAQRMTMSSAEETVEMHRIHEEATSAKSSHSESDTRVLMHSTH